MVATCYMSQKEERKLREWTETMNGDRAGSLCGSLFVGKGKGGLLCDT